jgi:hypothetical protein
MPIGVGQPVGGEAVQRRHADAAAVGRPGRLARVVVQDEQDIGGAFRRLWGNEGLPVRLGIADVELDLALEAAHEFSFGRLGGGFGTVGGQDVLTETDGER